jgi:hypothetical protein
MDKIAQNLITNFNNNKELNQDSFSNTSSDAKKHRE